MQPIIQNQSYWFIIQSNDLLLNKDNSLPKWPHVKSIASHFIRQFLLGKFNNIEYYCAQIATGVNVNLNPVPLKKALALFNNEIYSIGVKAYSVINWDKNHKFCGCCGSLTEHNGKGFERICAICGLSFFPRISPSIIVLIHKDDHLVMARSPHFPAGVYGLIAGFVEIGENLEEAVHREVKEEVGLEIKELTYFGSQPWPFPDSLMVAFTAQYAAGDILMDKEEIEDAGWYKYDNLPGRPSMPMSIASALLDNFVNFCKQQNA